jgi:hypothetical protein
MHLRPALTCAAILLFFLTGCSDRTNKETVPYEALVKRLADPAKMADLGSPGAKIATSYDRSGGNNDYGNFLKKGPEGWMVLADLKGPGYVSRFWSTGSKDGSKKLRFYFDGEKSPSIETTLDEWCGKKAPLTPPLAGYEPYCWYSWLPVPFEKRLIIMEQAPVKDEKLYYQIAYNTLPAGQTVESFKLPLSPAAETAIADVKNRWNNREAGQPVQGKQNRLELQGPGLIQELQFTPDWSGFSSPAAIEKALRELVVRIYWDGSSSPSVEAPLGALCGSMWSRTRYQSLYFGMTNEMLSLRFPMPFRSSAKVEITGAVPVMIAAVTGELPTIGKIQGYLHSGWKKSTAQAAGRPHTILQTAGSGKYVGCILGVRSLDQSWWVLEGDELITVDGEATPGWKGTGLEDYFNGGWYYGNALASPLNGIVFKALVRTVQYRIHQADPVAFTNSFNMIFERGPDNASRAAFESVSFYYLDRPQKADSDIGKQPVHPEPDPLSKMTLMTEINDRERLGDMTAAQDTVKIYLEEFKNDPFAPQLLQRLENYRKGETVPAGQALLGVYANMAATVFLDGTVIGRFGDPQAMQFKTVNLAPGRHVLAVQTARQNYPDWLQIGLKYGNKIIGTDGTWKFSFNPADGWTTAEFNDSSWETLSMWVKGPPEEPYVFCKPNEHVGMQSVPWGIRPSKDWPANARQAFYRKVFTVE